MHMPWSVRLRLLAVLAGALAVPPGCGMGEPSPQVYVLGDAGAAEPGAASQMNTPTVEVRPVRVPDYLDTTDIVTRGAGGLVVPSESGRWGERFSIGLTRAVAADLARKLPGLAVTTSARWSEPRWQVAIELEFVRRAVGRRQFAGSDLDHPGGPASTQACRGACRADGERHKSHRCRGRCGHGSAGQRPGRADSGVARAACGRVAGRRQIDPEGLVAKDHRGDERPSLKAFTRRARDALPRSPRQGRAGKMAELDVST